MHGCRQPETGKDIAMLTLRLDDRHDAFAVLESTRLSQAAIMTLAAGERTGTPTASEHPQADQWLLVLSGTGEARGERERHRLAPGVLLVIPAGQGHEIHNTGVEPMRSLNIYAPLAYARSGDPLQE